jgi:hypothetical protein
VSWATDAAKFVQEVISGRFGLYTALFGPIASGRHSVVLHVVDGSHVNTASSKLVFALSDMLVASLLWSVLVIIGIVIVTRWRRYRSA